MCVVVTEQINVMANCEELTPQNIWRYRGVALTDVVITGFDCVSEMKITKKKKKKTSVAKFEGKKLLGRPRSRRKDSINVHLTEIVYDEFDWIRRVSGNGHAGRCSKSDNRKSRFWNSAPAQRVLATEEEFSFMALVTTNLDNCKNVLLGV